MRTRIRAKIVGAAFGVRVLAVGTMLCVGLVVCGQNQPATMDKLPPQLDKKVKLIVNWGESISTRRAKLEVREAKRGRRTASCSSLMICMLPARQVARRILYFSIQSLSLNL